MNNILSFNISNPSDVAMQIAARVKARRLELNLTQEGLATRAGVKFKIKLPAEKNKDNCLEEYVGKEVIMGIRPENVHNEEDLVAANKDGIVEADVEVTELMGAETYLYMNCEGQSINARVAPTNTAKPGDKIKIALEPKKIHLFDKDTELTITN